MLTPVTTVQCGHFILDTKAGALYTSALAVPHSSLIPLSFSLLLPLFYSFYRIAANSSFKHQAMENFPTWIHSTSKEMFTTGELSDMRVRWLRQYVQSCWDCTYALEPHLCTPHPPGLYCVLYIYSVRVMKFFSHVLPPGPWQLCVCPRAPPTPHHPGLLWGHRLNWGKYNQHSHVV